MKNSSYWEKRAILHLADSEKVSEDYIKRIKKIYNKANRDIKKDIATIYKNYSKDTGLDIQTLKTLVSKKETDRFWRTLDGKGLKQYVKNNYKSRISRLEKLKGEIYSKVKDLTSLEVAESKKLYSNIYKNTYDKTIKDLSSSGLDLSFNTFDTKGVVQVLNEKWSGENYSSRIWRNTNLLAEKVSNIISSSIMTGKSISRTSQEIKEAFKINDYYITRLVRTEVNHFNNEAEYQAYKDLGVEKYIFVATLDGRTSNICQSMDGQIFNIKDKLVGVNFPPLHPNCRSTVRAYLGKENEPSKRIAKNITIGEVELIDNTTYSEWLKENQTKDILLNEKNNPDMITLLKEKNILVDPSGFNDVNEEVRNRYFSHLEELNKKYPLATKDKPLQFFSSNLPKNTLGNTASSPLNNDCTISLSKRDISNISLEEIRTKSYESVKSGWQSKTPIEKAELHTLTHEYGHYLQSVMLDKYGKENPTEFEIMKEKVLSTLNVNNSKKTLKNYTNKFAKKQFMELKEIYEDMYGSSIVSDLSEYGKSNYSEAWAESFAEYELTDGVTKLGKAVKVFLERNL